MTLDDHLVRCAATLETARDAAELYRAVDAALADLVGHRLFTLLIVTPDGGEVERVHSSNPAAYPLAGRKRMGPTPWGDHVLRGGRPWLGRTAADIEWAFPDHALIASLGLASCTNVPVRAFGRVLGTVNVLDAAGAYGEADVAAVARFAPLLALPFAEAGRSAAA